VTQVCDEPFPTLFYAYSPIFDPSGGRSFPSDDIASAALAAAALTAPGGNPARLEARDLEREITLMLELNLALKVERLALDDVTVFHIWQDGQERGRILVAPGNLAPGVRVYLALPEPGKTTCQYYLDPGWAIQLISGDGGPPRARIYRAEPAPGLAGSHRAVPQGKRGLRRRGPPATPDERKLEIVTGWVGATTDETQESYCNRVGIGVSTLRGWIRECSARGLFPEEKQ
jgi:hypothetical protein